MVQTCSSHRQPDLNSIIDKIRSWSFISTKSSPQTSRFPSEFNTAPRRGKRYLYLMRHGPRKTLKRWAETKRIPFGSTRSTNPSRMILACISSTPTGKTLPNPHKCGRKANPKAIVIGSPLWTPPTKSTRRESASLFPGRCRV